MPDVFQLAGERNLWTLSSLGGRLARWEARDGSTDRVVCKGDATALPSRDAHRAIVMFPWVNRIGGDHWTIDGERVPLDLSGTHTHLHGVVYDRPWETVEVGSSRVAFRVVVEPGTHYPRRVEATIAYEVVLAPWPGAAPGGSEAGPRFEALDVSMIARNADSRPAFVTMGTHPYFANPFGGTVDAMRLGCAAAREFAVDERMIPTGLGPPTPEHDFRAERPLGDTRIDSGFELRPGASPLATLALENYRLAIAPLENCGYAQIYVPPHREEIAIEPQSGGADAFRVPEYGLHVLAPGESFRWAARFVARFDA